MSGGFPTSGSEPPPPPPPGSPSRTLFLSLAACMFFVSFAIVVVVTAFVLFCRRRRPRSSALPGDRCGGDPFPDVEATLPAFPYAPEDAEQGGSARECAVCLCAVKEREMVRQLPACRHLYHAVCIDRWLAAHRTCPVCRSQLGSSTSSGAGGYQPDQSRV